MLAGQPITVASTAYKVDGWQRARTGRLSTLHSSTPVMVTLFLPLALSPPKKRCRPPELYAALRGVRLQLLQHSSKRQSGSLCMGSSFSKLPHQQDSARYCYTSRDTTFKLNTDMDDTEQFERLLEHD
ncbi:hypothetical protein Tco_0150717 [Tanacetum coccineum]